MKDIKREREVYTKIHGRNREGGRERGTERWIDRQTITGKEREREGVEVGGRGRGGKGKVEGRKGEWEEGLRGGTPIHQHNSNHEKQRA